MTRLPILLVTMAAALLSGSAATVPAASASPPRQAATTTSSCIVPAPDQIVTVEESVQNAKQCRSISVPSWHWMGNYGSVGDMAAAASRLGVGPGALITVPNSAGGPLPTIMYL